MKIYYVFTLKVDLKNSLSWFEDVYQEIFLPKVHENPTSPVGVDSIFSSVSPLPQKQTQLMPVSSDVNEISEVINISKFTKAIFDICFTFYNLQG